MRASELGGRAVPNLSCAEARKRPFLPHLSIRPGLMNVTTLYLDLKLTPPLPQPQAAIPVFKAITVSS